MMAAVIVRVTLVRFEADEPDAVVDDTKKLLVVEGLPWC
jgi:hypothetical protein